MEKTPKIVFSDDTTALHVYDSRSGNTREFAPRIPPWKSSCRWFKMNIFSRGERESNFKASCAK